MSRHGLLVNQLQLREQPLQLNRNKARLLALLLAVLLVLIAARKPFVELGVVFMFFDVLENVIEAAVLRTYESSPCMVLGNAHAHEQR